MKNVNMARLLEFLNKYRYHIVYITVLSCLVIALNQFSNGIFMFTIIIFMIVALSYIKYIFNTKLITITFVCLVVVYGIEVYVSYLQFDHCNPKKEQIDNSGSEVDKPTATSDQNSSENLVDYWLSFFICTEKEKEKEFNQRGILSDYILHKIVYFTTQTSIILMIVIFIYLTRVAHNNYQQGLKELKKQNLTRSEEKLKEEKLKKEKNVPGFLTQILIGSLGISAIPTGISLTICAFYDIGLIKYMYGVEIYIAFAGISIVSIGFLSTEQEKEIIKDDTPKIDTPKDTDNLEPQDTDDLEPQDTDDLEPLEKTSDPQ